MHGHQYADAESKPRDGDLMSVISARDRGGKTIESRPVLQADRAIITSSENPMKRKDSLTSS